MKQRRGAVSPDDIRGNAVRMSADPGDVIVALREVLGRAADVVLDHVGEEPFAVVKLPAKGECWVNLAPSISAFPSSTPGEIARVIAESEGWVADTHASGK